MRKSRFSRLTKDMTLILFFSAGVPAFISLLIMFHQMQTTNELQKIEFDRAYDQTATQVSFALKNIQASLASLSQSPEVVDYMLTPENLKGFVENRLIGKITNSNSSIPYDFFIVGTSGKVLFSYPQTEVAPHDWKVSLSIDREFIYLSNPIQFDDQNFQSSNAVHRGFLVARVKKENLLSIFPQLIDVAGSSFESLSFKMQAPAFLRMESLFFYAAGLILIMVISILIGLRIARRRVIHPIQTLSREIFDRMPDLKTIDKPDVIDDSKNELKVLRSSFEIYISELQRSHAREVEAEKAKAFAKIASQVAHDVRSPISALNLVTSTLTEISEDKRVLLRQATNRINDIANNLLNRSKNVQKKRSVELLPAIVDSIVSEKRIEMRSKEDLRINLHLEESYGLYAEVDCSELKRVLSNLLNNAIESLFENGEVNVRFRQDSNFVMILIEDNGRGIPTENLHQLGVSGRSFGKNGNGLGLAHAKEVLSQWGGRLEIKSKVGQGTTVSLMLKRASPPSWFLDKIEVKDRVVIVDDDQSIHEIWKQRLPAQQLVHMMNGDLLKTWLSLQSIDENTFFFFDQEFLNQPETGLDLIEKYGLSSKSILVTSRYEELDVRKRASELGIKILPKGLSPWVPLSF